MVLNPAAYAARLARMRSVSRSSGEIVKQMYERSHQFAEVSFVKALVRRVCIRLRILDSQEQCRRAAEQLCQWTDETDTAAAADGDRILFEARLQCVHR